MDEIIDAMMGIDKKREIMTLWYEITYLRMIISQIITKDFLHKINFEKIKIDAQEVVRNRFPESEIIFEETNL